MSSQRHYLPIAGFLIAFSFQGLNAAENRQSVYNKVVPSVVAIVPDLEGEDTTIGTGLLLDAKRRLVLTNHHVIEGSTKCRVFFPLMKNGQIVSDKDATITESREIWAEVVDSSIGRDLAIIRLESIPEGTRVLRLARKNASPGDTIHSIAGSAKGTQGLWAYSTGHVRQRVVGGLANGGRTMVLESDMATNCGNSGGPVFNDQGEVVAVVEGHSTEARLVSIYVDRQSVIEYLANAKSVVSPKTAADYMTAAKRNAKEGRFEQAAKLCSQAIKLEPTAEAYCLRCEIWLAMDESELAGGDVDEALEIDPDYARAHMLDGKWYHAYGDEEDAQTSFSEAIRRDPEAAEYRFERASFRYATEDYEGAMSDVRRIARLSRVSDRHRLMLTRLKGKCEFHLGDVENAATDLVDVLENDASDFETLLFLGRICEDGEENESAIVYYEAAIKFDSQNEDARAFHELIDLYFETDQITKAFEASDVMTDRFPEDAFGWFAYGVSQIDDDPANAIKYVRHATELDPEHEGYKTTLASMNANN